MLSGIGTTLTRLLGTDGVRVLPAPSSVSLACARLGWAVEEVQVVSLVGRPLELLVPHVQPGRRLLVLGSDGGTPAQVAALLAARGYTAAPDSLEGRRGMFRVMSARGDAAELSEGLGERWEIFRNGFKPYSCGVVTHPGIDAVRRLGRVHGVRPEDVETIDLRVHPLVLELTGKTDPQTGLEGKFSIAFASAIALIEGTARQRQFTDVKVRRPDVVALMRRIQPAADTSLSHTEAVAIGRLTDGRSISEHVTAATGTPENPISDEELREKFLDLVEPVLGAQAGERIAALVNRLEDVADVSEIVSATIRAS
jgi:2-methylcitrate dehydratase PrpD